MASTNLYFDIYGRDKGVGPMLDHVADKGGKLNSVMAGLGGAIGGLASTAIQGALSKVFSIFTTGLDEIKEASAMTAQFQAGIQSTGNMAGVTVDGMTNLANSIQAYSGQTDESIGQTENLLLTFTNIRNVGADKIFDQATAAAANMAAKFGGDASDKAIVLGKALQDPILGMTALRRVGIMFTDAQEATIKKMVETGDIVGAQKVILAELTKEFGGAAEAAGNSLPGQLAKGQRGFEMMSEKLVTALMPALTGLIGFLTDAAKWVTENSELVINLGGALVVMAGGLAAVATAGLIVNALLSPITLVIAAIGGFVYAYETIGWFHDNVNTSFGEMKRFAEELATSWNTSIGKITQFFTDLTKNLTDFQASSLRFADETKANFQAFQDGAKSAVDNTKGMFADFNTNTKGMFDDFVTNTQNWDTQTKGMFDDFWKHVGEGWAGFWKDPIGETENFFLVTSTGFAGWSQQTSTTITTWITSTTSGFQGWNRDASASLTSFIDTTRNGFQTWNENLSRSITDWATGSKQSVNDWNQSTTQSIASGNANTAQSFADWNVTTSQNLRGWISNQDGGFRSWNAGVSGMVGDFARNTAGMISDWGNNTNGMFNDWHNNLTGKTRTTVDTMSWTIQNFNQNTIGMFRDFNNNTKGMFDDMFGHVSRGWQWLVDSIGRIWYGVREAARAPVDFVINTVINGGLIGTFNTVADFLKIGRIAPFHPPGFTEGGFTGAGGKFEPKGTVHGGEYVLTKEQTARAGVSWLDRFAASLDGYAYGGFVNPLRSMKVTQGYSTAHKGIDYAASIGTPVYAVQGGVVDWAGPGMRAPGVWGGNEVHIMGAGNIEQWYAHLSKIGTGWGNRVSTGQMIALSGNTGITSGPHLHFGMFQGGWPNSVNPQWYLGGAGIPGAGGLGEGGVLNPIAGIVDGLVSKFRGVFGNSVMANLAIGVGKRLMDDVGGYVTRQFSIGNVAGPKVYDNGGWLGAVNGTSRPEPVLTSQQWEDIHTLAMRGGMNLDGYELRLNADATRAMFVNVARSSAEASVALANDDIYRGRAR